MHGYFTAAELNGANGGMARYTLTLQPWFAFLGRSRDSRIFQDMTVFDILDAVFTPYQGLGKLTPAWRFDVADRSVYPTRSLTTHYQESDLAFAERLMSEESLYYFFTHKPDRHKMEMETPTRWREAHLRHKEGKIGSYNAYWSFEAAALAYWLKLDAIDADNIVFPHDLLNCANEIRGTEQFTSRGKLFQEAERLTARDGSVAPQSGL